MTRISSTFKRLGKVNEAALIPYVPVGYPSLDITRQLVPVVARQGADLIELGIPLTHVISGEANASERNVSLTDCLSVAAVARLANEIPLLFVSRYSPLHDYGPAQFAADAAASGIDGLIVPDLPFEAAADLKAACDSAGLDLIFTVVPTDTDAQLQHIAEVASGFIYFLSPNGATDAADLTARLRQYTDLPLAVGPDISTAEQVAEITRYADGAIIGSAITTSIQDLAEEEVILAAADCVRSLKAATMKSVTGAGGR